MLAHGTWAKHIDKMMISVTLGRSDHAAICSCFHFYHHFGLNQLLMREKNARGHPDWQLAPATDWAGGNFVSRTGSVRHNLVVNDVTHRPYEVLQRRVEYHRHVQGTTAWTSEHRHDCLVWIPSQRRICWVKVYHLCRFNFQLPPNPIFTEFDTLINWRLSVASTSHSLCTTDCFNVKRTCRSHVISQETETLRWTFSCNGAADWSMLLRWHLVLIRQRDEWTYTLPPAHTGHALWLVSCMSLVFVCVWKLWISSNFELCFSRDQSGYHLLVHLI